MRETRGLLAGIGVVAIVLLGLRTAFAPDSSLRAVEFFPDMVRSPAPRTMQASAILPLGMVQQLPVEGIVIRGAEDFPFGTGPEECARAGRELRNPLPPGDAPSAERGALLYQRFCVYCHAADGEGQGPVVLRGMVPPPSFKAVRAMNLTDGELFHILTRGQNLMGSYATQITREDRWKLVRRIRELQKDAR